MVPDKWPQQKPVSIPLPCFAMSYQATHPTCMNCPHQESCVYYMGSRAHRVPVDRTEFRLIPAAYGEHYAEGIFDDPEIPNMQRM